jgi:hypothetical protein
MSRPVSGAYASMPDGGPTAHPSRSPGQCERHLRAADGQGEQTGHGAPRPLVDRCRPASGRALGSGGPQRGPPGLPATSEAVPRVGTSPEEVRSLIDAAGTIDPALATMVLVAALTGARQASSRGQSAYPYGHPGEPPIGNDCKFGDIDSVPTPEPQGPHQSRRATACKSKHSHNVHCVVT